MCVLQIYLEKSRIKQEASRSVRDIDVYAKDNMRSACTREAKYKRAHWDRVDHVTAGIRDKAYKRRASGPRSHGYHELNIRVARGFHQPRAVIPRIHPAKRSSLSFSLSLTRSHLFPLSLLFCTFSPSLPSLTFLSFSLSPLLFLTLLN